MDESVATLLHMGKETCRKLADLSTAADQADLELDLEEELTCIEKVGKRCCRLPFACIQLLPR